MLIIRRINCINTASGTSLCVGDRFVCRLERIPFRPAHETVTDRVTFTRGCIDTIDSPDDEHEVARNM